MCGFHHRAHHRGRFDIDINPANGLVRFTRPGGGVILGRAATAGAVLSGFPVEPGTLPTRWDGSPLRVTELTPPWKERTAPTGLRFASPEPPEATAARLAATLRCRFEHEGDVWVTSTPDLITVTPDQAGGSVVTVELTTHPTSSPSPSPPSASPPTTPTPRTAPAATTADHHRKRFRRKRSQDLRSELRKVCVAAACG